MSPRKLTEDDKQEILEQYRNSEATTSTLAKSFEVSSSTISRFLKNKLTTVEYEDLIQQKRLARTPRGETSKKSAAKSTTKAKAKTKTKTKAKAIAKDEPQSKVKSKRTKRKSAAEKAIPELETAENLQQNAVEAQKSDQKPESNKPESNKPEKRTRRRRRSASRAAEAVAAVTPDPQETPEVSTEVPPLELEPVPESVSPAPKLVLDKVKDKPEVETVSKSDRLILKSDLPEEEDEDEDEMDLQALTEMLGEDLEDINDDDDDEEDDDWDDEDDSSYSAAPSDLSDIQILPLAEASLPRICYLVIDRSAELIVKPLAEFADLGAIPDAETSQRTLPVFDNHRIAKRFSHRRERVIKVPDSRMLQKTSHHLQGKGITRLLIDGQIYSLSQ
ncbi:MAG: hypothetical protein AAGK10_17325 [Cyanobacteria bacterium J06555_3]